MINGEKLKKCIAHLSGVYRNGSAAIRVGRHEIFFVADNSDFHVQVVIGKKEPGYPIQRGYYVVRDFINSGSLAPGSKDLSNGELLGIDGKFLRIGGWKQPIYTFMEDNSRFFTQGDEIQEMNVEVPWDDVARYSSMYSNDPYTSTPYRKFIGISTTFGLAVTDGNSIVQLNNYNVSPAPRNLLFPSAAMRAIKEYGDFLYVLYSACVEWVFDDALVVVKDHQRITFPNINQLDYYSQKLTSAGVISEKAGKLGNQTTSSIVVKDGALTIGGMELPFTARSRDMEWSGTFNIKMIVNFIKKAKRQLEILIPLHLESGKHPIVLQGQGVRFMIMPGMESTQ